MSKSNQHREKSHRKNLLSCSKNVGRINTYGIDRTIMTLHFSNWHKSIHVPEFQNAPSAATKQNWVAGHNSQGTHPILMCIWNLLRQKRNQQFKESFQIDILNQKSYKHIYWQNSIFGVLNGLEL